MIAIGFDKRMERGLIPLVPFSRPLQYGFLLKGKMLSNILKS